MMESDLSLFWLSFYFGFGIGLGIASVFVLSDFLSTISKWISGKRE